MWITFDKLVGYFVDLGMEIEQVVDVYPKLVEVNGFIHSPDRWLFDNIETALPVIEQLRGETIYFVHRNETIRQGKLLGVSFTREPIMVGTEIWSNYKKYTFRIQDGYKRRRLALLTTRIWHPAIHAVYLMNK